MSDKLTLVARLLISQIFLLAGFSKIGGYAATAGYMEAMGVSGSLLSAVIALEIGTGLALVLGWQTRWTAIAMSAFTVAAALIFHSNFADQMQMMLFTKNIAMAGGLLVLSAHGAGVLSLDHWLQNRRDPSLATA